MVLVLRKLVALHFYFNNQCSDPRVRDWPLMSSPGPGLCILATYLFLVLRVGPRFMENRKPFKLDRLLQVYNIVQVLCCGWLVFESLRLGYFTKYSVLCTPVDYSMDKLATDTAWRAYIYFLIKVMDLLDTVFFVLRKKQNQVTFLHVYHHTGMVMLAWAGTKYFPGGHSIFMGILNSFVHVVMYFYYFLSSLSDSYKKSIWWKKYITQLQMVQFGLIALHWMMLLVVPDCGYPRWPTMILVPQNLFMFLLFYDFYRKAYSNQPKGVKGN